MYFRNYLRVRGEYGRLDFATSRMMELPPRARRIRISAPSIRFDGGTTSACAENTGWGYVVKYFHGNYLRVRGEYVLPPQLNLSGLELPPRARRIRDTNVGRGDYRGTTSACAENTQWLTLSKTPWRNYLRVRGEYGGAGVIVHS